MIRYIYVSHKAGTLGMMAPSYNIQTQPTMTIHTKSNFVATYMVANRLPAIGLDILPKAYFRRVSNRVPSTLAFSFNQIAYSSCTPMTASYFLILATPSTTYWPVPRQDTCNYRSIISKLNYITQNTRPDLSFAVHQCAYYSSSPIALHKLAIKQIWRYLLATRDWGLILHPSHNLKLDMYVDADCAGMWH
jgi:hypothetical protein